MSSTSNHRIFKERAKVILDAASPTIFIAALIGVGIPIVLGWMNGGGDGFFKITVENVQDIDIHNLRHLFDTVWGQLTAAIGGLLIGFYALWALVFGLAIGAAKVILHYGFVDYILHAWRGHVGQPQDVLVGFRIPVRVVLAHVLKDLIVWIGTVCFIIPGIVAGFSLRMTERVMIDHPELSVLECMRRSHALMRGHRFDLFSLYLSFFGWSILESLTRNLSGIYSRPYLELAVSGFYEALLEENAADEVWM